MIRSAKRSDCIRREGLDGHNRAVEVRAGQSVAAVERTGYGDSSTERVEHRRTSTWTTKDECRRTSQNLGIPESSMGETEGTEGSLYQSWQARSHLTDRSG